MTGLSGGYIRRIHEYASGPNHGEVSDRLTVLHAPLLGCLTFFHFPIFQIARCAPRKWGGKAERRIGAPGRGSTGLAGLGRGQIGESAVGGCSEKRAASMSQPEKTGILYEQIIARVIEDSRERLESEGADLQVLGELQKVSGGDVLELLCRAGPSVSTALPRGRNCDFSFHSSLAAVSGLLPGGAQG